MRILFSFALFLLILPGVIVADDLNQSTVLKDRQAYLITEDCSYFFDASDNFVPSTSSSGPDILLVSNEGKKLSLGFRDEPLWLKCQISNQSNIEDWMLSVNLPQVSEMQVHSFVGDYLLRHQSTGMFTPYEKRPVKDFIPAIKLKLPAASVSTHWIKINAIVPLEFDLSVASLENYHSELNVRLVVNSMFFGIMLALLSYNLFLYISIRDKSFLYYSLYLVCICFYAMMLTGLSQKLLFANYPKAELLFVVFAATGTLFFALKFALKFLRLGVYRPKLKRPNQFHYSALTLCIIVGLFGSFQLYSIALSLYSMLFISYIIWLAVISWKKIGYQPAKRFLIAWGCLLIGIIIHGLEFNSVINRSFISSHIIQITTICEAVMLSFALGERFNLLKEEREKNQIKSTQQLNEANLKLKQALKLSEEANEAKAQLVSLISHELRTPINIVQGSIESIQETSSSDQETDIQNANKALKKLTHHVENLITSAELLNRALTPCDSHVDVAQLMKSWINYVQLNKDPRVTFSYDLINHNEELISFDQRIVNKIVINLLDNACKFTKQGHIKLRLECQDSSCFIIIKDSGAGISDTQMPQIKQEFKQASHGLDRNYEGLGLGLTLAIHLANLIEGKLDINSKSQQSTTVTLHFPNRKIEQEVQGIESESESIGPFLHERLLIVEDNKINAMVLSRLLKITGCQLDLAEDGKQALHKLETTQYDLIFMDLQMPIMDGITATHIIRDTETVHTPIIAVTANASQDDQERCAKAGMNGFVSKPIIKETLYAEISRWFLVPGNE
jgi:two-component system, sensor histidine kinase LadS